MVPETISLHIETIAQMHQMLDVAKPRHPLFSILRFEDFPKIEIEQRTRLITDFYQVTYFRLAIVHSPGLSPLTSFGQENKGVWLFRVCGKRSFDII